MFQHSEAKKRSLRTVTAVVVIALLATVMVLPARANGTWTSTSVMAHSHSEHQAVMLNDGRVLVENEIYSPTTGT